VPRRPPRASLIREVSTAAGATGNHRQPLPDMPKMHDGHGHGHPCTWAGPVVVPGPLHVHQTPYQRVLGAAEQSAKHTMSTNRTMRWRLVASAGTPCASWLVARTSCAITQQPTQDRGK
jgi:hypothetical protein